jgi:hypothetical protein
LTDSAARGNGSIVRYLAIYKSNASSLMNTRGRAIYGLFLEVTPYYLVRAVSNMDPPSHAEGLTHKSFIQKYSLSQHVAAWSANKTKQQFTARVLLELVAL